jgi:hypothetical protein
MSIDREALIEQVVGAFRERSVDGAVQAAPAWRDLEASGRIEAFDRALVQRRLEAATDAEGLSATARSVLARIRR